MTTATLTPAIRCGNRNPVDFVGEHRHAAPDEVRACYAATAAYEAYGDRYEYNADAAYERHLEDRGYDEARAQDEHEARHGVTSFIESWHIQSPATCPCDDHEDDEPDDTCHCGHPECGAC